MLLFDVLQDLGNALQFRQVLEIQLLFSPCHLRDGHLDALLVPESLDNLADGNASQLVKALFGELAAPLAESLAPCQVVQWHRVSNGAVAVKQVRLEVAGRDGEFEGHVPVYLLERILSPFRGWCGFQPHRTSKNKHVTARLKAVPSQNIVLVEFFASVESCFPLYCTSRTAQATTSFPLRESQSPCDIHHKEFGTAERNVSMESSACSTKLSAPRYLALTPASLKSRWTSPGSSATRIIFTLSGSLTPLYARAATEFAQHCATAVTTFRSRTSPSILPRLTSRKKAPASIFRWRSAFSAPTGGLIRRTFLIACLWVSCRSTAGFAMCGAPFPLRSRHVERRSRAWSFL